MKCALGFLLALTVVGIGAPFVCGGLPLLAHTERGFAAPAFADLVAEAPSAPGGGTWKAWWLTRDDRNPGWACMPLVPFGPDEVDPEAVRSGPSARHWLGTDDVGRDLLARSVHGAATAVLVALGAVLLAALIGLPLGIAAGLRGGWVDAGVARLIEIFCCFPKLLFALVVGAFLGPSLGTVIVVLGLIGWTTFARLARGELLSLREREFVQTARLLGVGELRLVTRHLLPAMRGPLLVACAFGCADAVLVESTLSFLGLGPGLQVASWGGMLAQAKAHPSFSAWHLWVFPGLLLLVTVWALHAAVDAVRPPRV